MAATAQSFGISLGVYAAFLCLMVFIFSLLRTRNYFVRFFCAKRYMSEADQPVRPRPLSRGFLAWIVPTWKATEDEVILTAGVDAAMYLRIFEYGLWFFGLTSLWVLIVVLPTNVTQNEVSVLAASPNSGSGTYSTLDKLTMSNVPPQSSKLWLHAVSTWVVSIFAYHLLRKYSRDAVALRLKHLSLAQRGAETHSIVVMDIPGIEAGSLYSKVDSLLFFLPKGLKAKVKARILAERDRAMQRAMALRRNKQAGQGKAEVASSMQGVKRSQATLDAAQERTQLGEPMGPSLDPKHPMRFVPACELDAVSGALLEMEQDHESPEQMVQREYEELYGSQLQTVHPVYKPTRMSKLCKEYNKLRVKMLDTCDTYELRMRKNKKIKRKTTRVIGLRYGEWGRHEFGTKPVKVDMLQWQIMRLDELRRQIQEEAAPKQRQISSTAFVTFKTRQAQQVASSSMQHHDLRTWHTQTAPNPDTVIWSNLGQRAWERQLRRGLIWAAFVALTVFYAIPVGAIQALVEVDRLQNVPGFKQLLQITFIKALLQSVFPSLVLRIFLLILPWILGLMTQQEGVIDTAVKDARISTKYFIFQVINVFIVSFISGSFFTNFKTWIKNPTSAATILGTAAPLQSIFFLSYVELNALFSSPLGFLRPVPLIKYILMSGLAGTERKRYRVWATQQATYGTNIPSTTITILLGTVFSVINPLLPPMAFVYMLVNFIINKFHLLYNTRPAYAAGGKMWSQVVDQIITGLIFFQLIMTALLGVRQSYAAILVVILLPITILVRFQCFALFQRPLQLLSVRAAVDLDIQDREEGGAELAAVDDDMYLHPGFKLDVAKHELMLEQAGHMQAILDGKQELPPLEPGAEGGGHDVSTMASLDPMGDDELAKGVSQRPSRMVSQADEEDVLTTRDGLMRRNSHDSSSAPV